MKQLTLNVQGERLSFSMEKDTISSFELLFYANEFISVFVESIQGINSQSNNMWLIRMHHNMEFFLAAN